MWITKEMHAFQVPPEHPFDIVINKRRIQQRHDPLPGQGKRPKLADKDQIMRNCLSTEG